MSPYPARGEPKQLAVLSPEASFWFRRGETSGSIIVATTQTDAAGKFEFKNLKAGKYRLVLLPSDPNSALTKVGPGTLQLPSANEIATSGKQATVADGAQLQL